MFRDFLLNHELYGIVSCGLIFGLIFRSKHMENIVELIIFVF